MKAPYRILADAGKGMPTYIFVDGVKTFKPTWRRPIAPAICVKNLRKPRAEDGRYLMLEPDLTWQILSDGEWVKAAGVVDLANYKPSVKGTYRCEAKNPAGTIYSNEVEYLPKGKGVEKHFRYENVPRPVREGMEVGPIPECDIMPVIREQPVSGKNFRVVTLPLDYPVVKCNANAMIGVTVCKTHGGLLKRNKVKAMDNIAEARKLLFNAIPTVTKGMIELATSAENEATRFKAQEKILSLNGVTSVEEIKVEVSTGVSSSVLDQLAIMRENKPEEE